jgi:hypothetical protein
MLKLSVEKIEDVAEPLRDLYEEKDGKFTLKVEGIDTDYVPRDALKRANDESAARRKELETWKKIGKSEDEIRELISAAEKAEENKAKRAGDFDKLRDAMAAQHAKDLKAKDDAMAAKDKAIQRHLIDAQATAAIAAAKGSSDLLLPHVQKNVRVIEDNGDYLVTVVDAKGDPRINGKGEPMTIADLVGEMRQSDVYGRAFEGSGHSGSGMRPAIGNNGGTPGTTKSIPRAEFIALSPVDQMAKVKAGFTITEPPQ